MSNIDNLKANLQLPISDRKSVAERESELRYEERLKRFEAIKNEVKN